MRWLAVLVALLLVGCSSDSGGSYSQYFQLVRQGFSPGSNRISRAEAAAVPYPSLGLIIGNAPENMLILATDSGGDQLWTSGAHIALLIRDGRIVRSVGLGHDLTAATAQGTAPSAPLSAAVTGPTSTTRLEDFPDLKAYGVIVHCTGSYKGARRINTLGLEITTYRVDEACDAPALKWEFTDSYWLDQKSGRVWRSVQHIHPKLDTVGIEVLRQSE